MASEQDLAEYAKQFQAKEKALAQRESQLEKIANGGNSSGISEAEQDKQYLWQQVYGHAGGALASIVGAGYSQVLGYVTNPYLLTAVSEFLDFLGDNTFFHAARAVYDRNVERYQGIAGKGRFLYDCGRLTAKHLYGKAAEIIGGGLTTLGTLFLGYNAFIAAAAGRVVGIALDIITNYDVTKPLRREMYGFAPAT